MTKIDEHAELLRDAANKLVGELKREDWMAAKATASNISKHRSVILAIIEAVEELQPTAALVQPLKRRYPNGHKRSGDLSRYIAAQLQHLKPGEVVLVRPSGDFTEERLRSASAAQAGRMWGLGNYITAWVPGEGVEVMRVK